MLSTAGDDHRHFLPARHQLAEGGLRIGEPALQGGVVNAGENRLRDIVRHGGLSLRSRHHPAGAARLSPRNPFLVRKIPAPQQRVRR
jgi:hypothetical protein